MDHHQTWLTGTCDLDLWGQGHPKVKGHAKPIFADFNEIWWGGRGQNVEHFLFLHLCTKLFFSGDMNFLNIFFQRMFHNILQCCRHAKEGFSGFLKNRRMDHHQTRWTGACDLDLWGQGHPKVKGHAEPIFADFNEIC